MKAEILKIQINTLLGCLTVGSFALWCGHLIWQAAHSLPYGIPPAGF